MRWMVTLLPLAAIVGGCVEIPKSRDSRQSVSRSTSIYSPRPEARMCLAELGATQASFTPMPDRYFETGCSTLNSVRLANLRSDDALLELSNLGPVTCPLANTFAGWSRFGADRAARQILGSPLVRIETMGSFNCRNVAGTNRRSGHATANAIDIAAFVLADGRRISVLNHWSGGSADERRFLRTVRDSACKRFGMVLGPDYNAAHRDHLHLEEKSGTFCR